MGSTLPAICFLFFWLFQCSFALGPYGDLKIYRYPLPDKFNFDLPAEQYAIRYEAPSSQYGLEWTLDLLLLSLGKYPRGVLVSNPEEADLFYVPFYSNLVQLNSPNPQEDAHELLRDHVPYLGRYRGRDHFFFVSVGWNRFWAPLKGLKGKNKLSEIEYPHSPILEKNDRITLIGSDLHFIFNFTSILVPYPDYTCLSDDRQWTPEGRRRLLRTPSFPRPPPRLSTSPQFISQENMPSFPSLSPRRTYLACFLGSVLKKKIIARQHLQFQVQVYEQLPPPPPFPPRPHHSSLPVSFTSMKSRNRMDMNELISILGKSYFCLCPPGDSPHTKRLFNALFLGCIPVLLTHAQFHYPYTSLLPLPWSAFSIQFNESSLQYIQHENGTITYPNAPYQNIFTYLGGLSSERVEELQRGVMEVRKHMVFHWRENKVVEGDAMDLLMKELELLAKKVREDKYQFSEGGERGGEKGRGR